MLVQLFFWGPCSNASLERFFSQMRTVKIDWRNTLSEANLTSPLWIKVSEPSFKVFSEHKCLKAVEL